MNSSLVHTPADSVALTNGLGEISACECGGLRLTMGPLSLHFRRDEVAPLVELVHAAQRLVGAPRRRVATPRADGAGDGASREAPHGPQPLRGTVRRGRTKALSRLH